MDLPVLSSDAISSVSYACEEILPAPLLGMAAFTPLMGTAAAIAVLLFILVFSYRQTIDAYPGGGSYSVASENLGHVSGLALAIILLLTLGNLRGVRESSILFGVPAYLFIGSILALIGAGLFKVPALIVLFIFGGVCTLAAVCRIMPAENVTVIAQIASQVFGGSAMFYIAQATTAVILIMAANTSFADLPLLMSLLASLPVLGFSADTHLLLPLYAVGVFLSFTLSQLGMFRRWHKLEAQGGHQRLRRGGDGNYLPDHRRQQVRARRVDGAGADSAAEPAPIQSAYPG